MTIGDAVRGTRPPRIPPITTSVHAGNFMPLRWKKLDVLILDGATFKGHARLFLIPSASYNYGFFFPQTYSKVEHCWFKPLALPEFAPTLTDLQSKSLLFAELLSRGSLWSLYIFLSSYRCLSSLYFSCLLIIITSFSFPFFYSPLPFPSTHQPPNRVLPITP